MTGQREKMAATKQKILATALWSPPDDWEFDVDEIPDNQYLDDFTVGLLEFAKDQRMVTKQALKTLPLVFTEAGILRKDRKSGGRPFTGPDGKHVRLVGENAPYLSGDEILRKGAYSITTIKTAGSFQKFKDKMFNPSSTSLLREKRPHPGERNEPCKKPRKVRGTDGELHSSPNIDPPSNPSASEDKNQESEVSVAEHQKAPFEFKVGPFNLKTASGENDALKLKLEQREFHITVLEKKLAASEGLLRGVPDVLSRLIQRSALCGTRIITATVGNAINFSGYLEGVCEGGGEYFLTFMENCLTKSLKDLQEHRKARQSIAESLPNSNGGKVQIGWGMTADAIQKELDEEREAAFKEVEGRREELREKAKAEYRRKVLEQEEQKVRDMAHEEERNALEKSRRVASAARPDVFVSGERRIR